MANNTVTIPYQYWADPTRGKPLSGGLAYIGEPNLDPEMHPIDVFYVVGGCESCLVPAPNPVPIGPGGIILYNGFAVEIATNRNYSIRVLDSNGNQAYYEPSNEFSDNELVAIARSLNVPVSAVIYSTDTTTVLDNVQYIYDASSETTWIKPSDVQLGDVIVSVAGDQLTVTSGTYAMAKSLELKYNAIAQSIYDTAFHSYLNLRAAYPDKLADGIEDWSSEINTVISVAGAIGGKGVFVDAGNYGLSAPFTVSSGVDFVGSGYQVYNGNNDGTTFSAIGSYAGVMSFVVGFGSQLRNCQFVNLANESPNGIVHLNDINGLTQTIECNIENVRIYGNWDTENSLGFKAFGASPSTPAYYNKIDITVEHCGKGVFFQNQVNGNKLTVFSKSCRRHVWFDATNSNGALENTVEIRGFGSSGDIPSIGAATVLTLRNGVQGNTFKMNTETSSGGQALDIDSSSEDKNSIWGRFNEVTQVWYDGIINDPISNTQDLWNFPSNVNESKRLDSYSGKGVWDARFLLGGANQSYKLIDFPSGWKPGNPYTSISTIKISGLAGGGAAPFYGELRVGLGKIPTGTAITVSPIDTSLSANWSTYVDDVLFCQGTGVETPGIILSTAATFAGGQMPILVVEMETAYGNVNKPSIELVQMKFVDPVMRIATANEIADSSTII